MSTFENAFKGWASTVIGLLIVLAQLAHFMDIYHVPRIDTFSEHTNWLIFGTGCVFAFIPRTKLEEWAGVAFKAILNKFTKDNGAK